MKKTIVTTILFLFIAFNIHAQKSDLIIGKWVFSKALNNDIDEAGLAYLKAEVIGKWKFEFMPDRNFVVFMDGEKTTGEWKLIPESDILILIGIEGGPQEFKILKSTANELSLKLGLGEFLLTRINN